MIGIGRNLAQRPTANVWQSGAALEFRFADDMSVKPRIGNAKLLCTRSGDTATVFNRYGVLETVLRDTPRLNHDPSVLRYENLFTYSRKFNFGTAWAKGTGLSSFFTATDDAMVGPYGNVEAVGFVSTPTTSQGLFLRATQPQVAGTYTVSLWMYVPTQSGITNWSIVVDAQDTTDFSSSALQTTFDAWVRVPVAITYTATRTFLDFNIRYNGTTAPSSAGFTFYACRAQMNSGSSMLEYQDTGATAFPKEYACEGLVEEVTRTNYVRNNTMAGAVVGDLGSGGSLGTYWASAASATGITRSVVGFGTEDGISYVDLRVYGTVTAAGNVKIFPDGSTYLTAGSQGQSWASSLFLRLVAGGFTGVSVPNLVVEEYASGVYQTGTATALSSPSASALSLQRQSARRTLTSASTNLVGSYFYFLLTNGASVDFTIRIGMPGLELLESSTADITSVIPTSGSTATRNADNYTVLAKVPSGEGTMLVEWKQNFLSAGAVIASLDDGTSGNSIRILTGFANPAQHRFDVTSGGVAGAQPTLNAAATAGTVYKVCAAFKANDVAASENGAAVLTDASVAIPTVTTIRLGGGNGNAYMNGPIRRFLMWNNRIANGDVQAQAA